jgi:hypothetical protein
MAGPFPGAYDTLKNSYIGEYIILDRDTAIGGFNESLKAMVDRIICSKKKRIKYPYSMKPGQPSFSGLNMPIYDV